MGMENLVKTFGEVAEAPDSKEMEKHLLEIARYLRKLIAWAAPDSEVDHKHKIKKAIVAKRFRNKLKRFPAVFVAIDKKKAPHWHWVEYGTSQPFRVATSKARKKTKPGARWVWFDQVSGSFKSAKKVGTSQSETSMIGGIVGKIMGISAPSGNSMYGVGKMPAGPFFRPTVDQNRSQCIAMIKLAALQTITHARERKANRISQ